jgi:hypothetical protein
MKKNSQKQSRYFGTVNDSAAVVLASVVAAAIALSVGFQPMATVAFGLVSTGAVFVGLVVSAGFNR